jgi:hypothetical protein
MPDEGPEVDAYVFMHVLDPGRSIPGVVESFGSKEGVRWAQHFIGSSVVFGAVTVSSLRRLHELIVGDYWEAGARSEWSLSDTASVYKAPHRHSPPYQTPPYYAIVRVRTSGNPRTVLDALDQSMGPMIESFIADHGDEPAWREFFDFRAATVSGEGVDILVEMAAHSIDELKTMILDRIGPTEGVVSTDSSFAYAPHMSDSHPIP